MSTVELKGTKPLHVYIINCGCAACTKTYFCIISTDFKSCAALCSSFYIFSCIGLSGVLNYYILLIIKNYSFSPPFFHMSPSLYQADVLFALLKLDEHRCWTASRLWSVPISTTLTASISASNQREQSGPVACSGVFSHDWLKKKSCIVMTSGTTATDRTQICEGNKEVKESAASCESEGADVMLLALLCSSD